MKHKHKKANKGKHLTLEDRHYIEDALNQKFSLKVIADRLEKDPTTISKEVRRNRIKSRRNKQTDVISCSKRRECTKKHICSESCNHCLSGRVRDFHRKRKLCRRKKESTVNQQALVI